MKDENKTKIKICGITNLEDALTAETLGADFLGFIFVESSPRYIKLETAKNIISKLNKSKSHIKTVGVFVNNSFNEIEHIVKTAKLDMVQVYQDYENKFSVPAIKVIRPKEKADLVLSNCDKESINSQYFLFDTYCEKSHGGAGKIFNWGWLPKDLTRILVAGGVTPENIAELIKYQPYGIDICSGVEKLPGIKSTEKLEKLFKAVNGE